MADPRLNGPAVEAFAGCALTPVSLETLLDELESQLANGEKRRVVGHHNLHSLFLCQRDTSVRDFYHSCQTCYVDGMGALWLMRAAGIDIRDSWRFSLMDCLPDVFDWAQAHGLSVFYLGASPVAVATAEEWITGRWPQLEVSLHHGYLNTAELQRKVLDEINALQPDLLLVGMGMPRQEAWINTHRDSLAVGIILQAGGTLDYYTGLQARPPVVLSQLGFAWLYRLLSNPRRLWRRYLVTPWLLLRPTWRLRRALRREQEMPQDQDL